MAPVATSLTIGALLGKGDAAFRAVGGSSLVASFLRSLISGRRFNTLEYPDGNLLTVQMYGYSMLRFKHLLADAQPEVYPTVFLKASDIKQVYAFTAPFFLTEVCDDASFRRLPDGAWIVWSSLTREEEPIPRRGYKLDYVKPPKVAKSNDESSAQGLSALEHAQTRIERQVDETLSLLKRTRAQRFLQDALFEELVQRAARHDPAVLALSRNFRDEPEEFVAHAIRLAQNGQTGATKTTTSKAESATDVTAKR
ncbi:hypothetical protein FVE85_6552 [Porphyridium purpureum]|uniref:Uncharacterized protein n=1 Tax=Porphyridium purpureum TaxID=35688 RepID=A0A5J4Z8D4_PORPP|nr:hypothetical protein FVE85_6552 [Porphyridium purpureum]|eukprot:POR9871..scf295_1